LSDILGQADTLRDVVAGLHRHRALGALARQLQAGVFRRVVLTGMGTSFHALYPLHLALHRRGLTSLWIETAELLLGFDGLYQRDTLCIAVSQSGASAEIVRLLSRAGEFGHVLGITNHEVSPLGQSADSRLLLHSGVESTVSCKSYLATLSALYWLEAALRGTRLDATLAQLRSAVEAIRRYLACWRAHVAEWLAIIDGVQSIFITGRGESLATTGTGGLILKESARYPAEGMSCASFRHGPMEILGPGVLLLVFAGNTPGLNRRLFEDARGAGGRVVFINSRSPHQPSGSITIPRVNRMLRPLVEILPVQMLSLALAARQGREAGRFERAAKVTTVE
jgi:glucosamine--fructose-6-phosphate aminotransferase (isomerizing)